MRNRSSDMADPWEFVMRPASNRPGATAQATFGGEFLNPSIPAMAAAYLFHLCQNHAFIDGNKRVGANASITFLLINDWDLKLNEEELVELVLSIASGRVAKPQLIEIFESRCKPGEDPCAKGDGGI